MPTSIAYESYYTSNLSLVSVAGTGYTTAMSLAYAPVDQQDFIEFSNWALQVRGISSAEARFQVDSVDRGEQTVSSGAALQPQVFYHVPYADRAISTHTLRNQQRTVTGGGGYYSGIYGQALCAIGGLNIVAQDTFFSGASFSTSEVDLLEVSYTPSEGGKDHLIITSCDVVGGIGSQEGQVKIKIDGDEKMISRTESSSAQRRNGGVLIKKVNWDATEHTVKFTGQTSTGNGSVEFQAISIIQLDA